MDRPGRGLTTGRRGRHGHAEQVEHAIGLEVLYPGRVQLHVLEATAVRRDRVVALRDGDSAVRHREVTGTRGGAVEAADLGADDVAGRDESLVAEHDRLAGRGRRGGERLVDAVGRAGRARGYQPIVVGGVRVQPEDRLVNADRGG